MRFFMKTVNVDTMTFQLPFTIAFHEVEHFIQFQQPIKLKHISSNEDSYTKTHILAIGDKAKIKIQLHRASKKTKIEFYGLYQYTESGSPLNELEAALVIIEELLKTFNKPLQLTRVDLAFDTQENILTSAKPKLQLFANISYRFHPKNIKTFHENLKITGISFNKAFHRFKLTAYDKAYKNSLAIPLYRIELTVKEKHRKPVPITEPLDINSYLKLIEFEFEEKLGNTFKPYKIFH